MHCLLNCSLKCFPLKEYNRKPIKKFWWDNSLKDLKTISISQYNNWKASGFPKFGDAFTNFYNSKKAYHKLIQKKKKEHQNKISDNLLNSFTQNNTVKFWKLWNANFKSKDSVQNCTFGGLSESKYIANHLANSFKLACSPVNLFKQSETVSSFLNSLSNNCITSPTITVDMVDKAINKISNSTASSHDSISIEHFKFAHPCIVVILAKLFSIFLDVGVVPTDFCLGITTPIPKYKGIKKNVCSDDFRGITVNPIVSKIFEHCLVPFFDNLSTSVRQFGFKKGIGCLNSIHTVRKIINYFNKSGSTVNIATIDLMKAFDKTSVHGVLNMLHLKGVNTHVIKTLESWFTNQSIRVKWNDCLSDRVSLTSGVREGGVLSPLLFNAYVDCVLDKLQESSLGCFIGKECLNSFMYADDLILLSISVYDLQRLINLCSDTFTELDLHINIMKSHTMRIGPRFKAPCANIIVNNQPLPWVTKIKFLGITIISNNLFTCDWHESRSNFYRASNKIFSNLGANPPIDVTIKLIKTKCLPILMYGMSAVAISAKELSKLTFAYNSILWKLFGIKSKDEFRFVQHYCNYLDLSHLLNYHRFCFLNKLYSNGSLRFMKKIDEPDSLDLSNLSRLYNLHPSDSNNAVKGKIWSVVNNDLI